MAAYTVSAGLITLVLLATLLILAYHRPALLPVGEGSSLLDAAVAYHVTVNALIHGLSDPLKVKEAIDSQLSHISPLYHRFSSYRILHMDYREGYVGMTVVWKTSYGSEFLTTPMLMVKELYHRYYFDRLVAGWVLESGLMIITDKGYPPRVEFACRCPVNVERVGSTWVIKVIVPERGYSANLTVSDWRGLKVWKLIGG